MNIYYLKSIVGVNVYSTFIIVQLIINVGMTVYAKYDDILTFW